MQRIAVTSNFTCAVIQALNRSGENCNHAMGLIWNNFRKEERSSMLNCPWICVPDCHTGPDCLLPSSSSALFLLINCLFPSSHSGLPWASPCSPAQSSAWGAGSSQPVHTMERPLHWATAERAAMPEGSFLLPWGLSPFVDGQDFLAVFRPQDPSLWWYSTHCHWSSTSCRRPQAQLTTAGFGEEPSQRMVQSQTSTWDTRQLSRPKNYSCHPGQNYISIFSPQSQELRAAQHDLKEYLFCSTSQCCLPRSFTWVWQNFSPFETWPPLKESSQQRSSASTEKHL